MWEVGRTRRKGRDETDGRLWKMGRMKKTKKKRGEEGRHLNVLEYGENGKNR